MRNGSNACGFLCVEDNVGVGTRSSHSEFCFWPVGQGLFYTGQINRDFNFVYDCGADQANQANLSRCIQKYVNTWNPRDLDFVIVSHPHYDHYSGIRFLAQKVPIRRLIIPFLGDDYETVVLNLFRANQDIQYSESVREMAFIMLCYAQANGTRIESGEEVFYSDITISVAKGFGVDNLFGTCEWAFHIFDGELPRNIESASSEVRTALTSLIGANPFDTPAKKWQELANFVSKNGDAWNRIVEVFEKCGIVTGRQTNGASIVLAHHPLYDAASCFIPYIRTMNCNVKRNTRR